MPRVDNKQHLRFRTPLFGHQFECFIEQCVTRLLCCPNPSLSFIASFRSFGRQNHGHRWRNRTAQRHTCTNAERHRVTLFSCNFCLSDVRWKLRESWRKKERAGDEEVSREHTCVLGVRLRQSYTCTSMWTTRNEEREMRNEWRVEA